MTQGTKERYLESLTIVTEYIQNHLDEKLNIEELAQKTHVSPFHFHRIMKGLLGEPLGSYINRIRVETAARLLRYSDLEIKEIAYRIGYDSPSSLSSVFKQYYQITPSAYRKQKGFSIMKPLVRNKDITLKAPKILEMPAQEILFVRITGPYGNPEYALAWPKLWGQVKEQKLFTKGIQSFGVCHDDPHVTEPDNIRYDACLTIHKPAKAKGEIGVKTLEGGKFAVFLYQGSYEFLGDVYNYIFGNWLLESAFELREEPPMERYISHPERTAPEKLKTEIYIPIQ
ncbi:AraC family transcriptional regulator [Aureisphaera galaxeae]|uniref:AraC family transcriptional regulator n=1 Tax=Aureisphaera galaxeae TaxID=1538023 RepID=UPI0023506955|nr:AraC family transcriptional regulator [Aureisphaera galaxeae]MDC8004650.1 AraC family transcriptional regulator [Aureisphaera galaxeae]